MTETPILDIRNLSVHFKVYGGVLKVLDGINLVVQRGQKVGLVGETGCGKTTSMRAALRTLPMPPARIPGGEILFEGQDVLKMNGSQLRRVRGRGMAMVFQDPTAALNPVFSVGQQIEAVVRYSTDSRLSRRETRKRAIVPLKEVALPDPERMLDTYPVQLSGGMRQRICIAMALVANPRLLIADEPGTSLDVTIQDQILRLLRNLVEEKGLSVIVITHTLGVVRELTDRVYVMYAGNMVEVAATPELFREPCHPYTRGLMAAVPKLSGGGVSDGIPGRLPTYMHPPPGCRFHPRCPEAIKGLCDVEDPPDFEPEPQHWTACWLYR